MPHLPAHAEHISILANIVSEIIVVDSQSKDGTTDYLKKTLHGHDVLFVDHPPGLYQSWNHAISLAKHEYTTVATVGDILPIKSLEKIYQTIKKFDADVVVTPPKFLGHSTNEKKILWPIHNFIEASGIRDAREIPGLVWMIYSLIYMPASLLSSSAGNLYRTEFLKQNPFPHEYGHPGDSVWALQMSLKARWVIDPEVESYYKIHEQASYSASTSQEAFAKLRQLASHLFQRSRDDLLSHGTDPCVFNDVLDSIYSYGIANSLKDQYKNRRNPLIPSFLNREAKKIKMLIKKNELERKSRKKRLNEYICKSFPCGESS
jgi:glycosyltransferase involved in cell wall biosynthesis